MPRRMIWAWPQEGGEVLRVDLGYSIQVLTPISQRDRATTLDGRRRPYHVDLGGGLRVKVRKERMTTRSMVAEMRAIENVLLRGDHIGIAADRSRAFCAWIPGGVLAGETALYTTANLYSGVIPDALALAAGDVLCLESGNPECRREEVIIDTITAYGAGYTITLTSDVKMDRDPSVGVLVRHEHFYPSLYLPADQLDRNLITDEHGALWTFDAELELDPGLYLVGMDEPAAGEFMDDAAESPFDPRSKWTMGALLDAIDDAPLRGATASRGFASALWSARGPR